MTERVHEKDTPKVAVRRITGRTPLALEKNINTFLKDCKTSKIFAIELTNYEKFFTALVIVEDKRDCS